MAAPAEPHNCCHQHAHLALLERTVHHDGVRGRLLGRLQWCLVGTHGAAQDEDADHGTVKPLQAIEEGHLAVSTSCQFGGCVVGQVQERQQSSKGGPGECAA